MKYETGKIVNKIKSWFLEKINKTDKTLVRDFPRGTVDKNPPANARGMGSIPGPGRSHMPQSN